MPATPRQKNKATEIVFKLLGMPENLRAKRTKLQEKIDKVLKFQETSRVR